VLPPHEVWRLWPKGYSSYWAETVFTLRVTVTLTFDQLTPKSIGVFYSIRAITLWSLKALAQRILELLSGNGFHSLGHCDLDLWPTDPKINRGLLLNRGYHPMKFEGSGPKGIQVIERKRFSLFGSVTFDLLTPKSIGVFYSIRATTLWSLKARAQRVLKLLSKNGFHSSGHCDLDLWHTNSKINRGILLNKGSLWSLKALGQRVLELLSGNGFHSLGHCDLDLWPTDPKINRGLLLNKGYHPMKFKGSGSKGTRVIERKRISLFGSLWPWPLTYWPLNQ